MSNSNSNSNRTNKWNVVLNTVRNGNVVPSSNNPKRSGRYVCTCIRTDGRNEFRYLMVMEYNAVEKRWHDVGSSYSLSHTILAWKYETVCKFSKFDARGGRLFEKGTC